MEAMWMKFMELQMQNAATRRLKNIDKITKKEDFPTWSVKLISSLKRQGLDKYITTDVPEPADPNELEKWKTDRSDVEEYIVSHVPGNQTWTNIRNMGWNAEENNPKKTFDLIRQFFESGSVDGDFRLHQELATIRREKFDSVEAYTAHVGYLRDRIDNTHFKLTEFGYIWSLVKGIQKEYPDLYNRSAINLQNKTITWKGVMAELYQLGVEESGKPALTSITTKTKPTPGGSRPANGKTQNNQNSSQTNQTPSPCGICGKDLYPDARHCDGGCGRHIRGDVCWYCNPDQAPEDWLNGNWRGGRNGRGGGRSNTWGRGGYRGGRGGSQTNTGTQAQGNTTTSTTGPLRQQSGNANPSTRTASTNALFTTNYDNYIAMTNLAVDPQDFQRGPQCN